MKKALKVIGIVIGAIVLVAVIGVLVLTITEYKPDSVEAVDVVEGSSDSTISEGDTLTVMTWNIGYGALGEKADFFMDGGTHVSTATKSEVYDNLTGIESEIEKVSPDVLFLQETDTSSKRSHYVDEREEITESFPEYYNSFALNYKVLYIPYPFPTMGKVSCGVTTLSRFSIAESERDALPCPFTYPTRICNLKRCLLVSRIPLEGSDKEIVLINLHLEAYDSGEGKIAQTKQLKTLIEEEAAKGNYVIAGGDFNQTFSNVDTTDYPQISEDMWIPGLVDVTEFDDSLQFIMDSDAPSCRSLDKAYAGADKDSFQFYIIDGFILSGNITVNDYYTDNLEFVNSDHNPLILNITLNGSVLTDS